jgi:membrane protease subunit HflK
MRRAWPVVGGVLLVVTAATALTRVQPGERAVVRRFGRILDDRPGPGLYRGWPWGAEQVERVPVGKVRNVIVGFTGADEDPGVTPAGQLLTGDHNLVNVQAELHYRVVEDQVDRYAVNQDRVEPLLARTAEAVLAEWVAGRTVDEVLTRGKIELPAVVRVEAQRRIAGYGLGVEIEHASITRLYPPDEVKAAFDEVAKAQTRIQTEINRASQEANRRLTEAEAEVYQRRLLTAAYDREQRLAAQADADAFLKRLGQYRELAATNPEYLSTLWLDEMTRIYTAMRESGRIDVLDHFLSKEGLNITQFPLRPRKK